MRGLGSDENHNFTKTTSFPRLQDEFPWDVMYSLVQSVYVNDVYVYVKVSVCANV